MPDVNKKVKVSVEVDGQRKVLELKDAVKALENDIASLTRRSSLVFGADKAAIDERIKKQTQFLEQLQKQMELQQKLDKQEEDIARKRKAREQAAELRAKREAIFQERERQDFGASPSFKGLYKRFVSPTERLRRKIAEQRTIEDEQTRFSVQGETPEIRAEAAAKAKIAGQTGKELSGKLAGLQVVIMVIKATLNALKFYKRIFDGIRDTFEKNLGTSLKIRENFNQILDATTKTTNLTKGAATYSSRSLVVNAAARQTQLRYGMTGGQAWAFNQASSALNVSGIEDLLYMNAGQRAVFVQYLQRQQQFYERLDRTGVLQNIQELQLDFKLFKEELAMNFLEWVAKNKDLILTVMQLTFNVLKGLLQVLGKVATLFGVSYDYNAYGFGSTAMSDASALNTSVSNRNVRVTMTNNVNGVFNQPEMESFLNEKLEAAVRSAATALGG